MNTTEIKHIKNKQGETKLKIVEVTNKDTRKGLEFDSIRDLYKDLLKKYKASEITIRGQHMDGGPGTIKEGGPRTKKTGKELKTLANGEIVKNQTGITTLKHKSFLGDDLRHADKAYWEDQPEEVMNKFFDKYYSIEIIIEI